MLAVSCGGHSPAPAPIPDPIPPANAKPVIESIAVQGRRQKEPANFADLSEPIDVTARVHDDETAVTDLVFEWSAPVGSFEGSGASVVWHAPDTAKTPSVVTISLKVIEHYGFQNGPKTFQQDVSSSVDVSLHDSVKEVSEIAKQFLLDFSDSSIRDVGFIMRNFQKGCYGTEAETDEVAGHRRRYQIIESHVDVPKTTVSFGGICPFRARPGDACSAVPVFWRAIDFDDHNHVGVAVGTDWVASVYVPTERRWWLCDSQFDGRQTFRTRFIR